MSQINLNPFYFHLGMAVKDTVPKDMRDSKVLFILQLSPGHEENANKVFIVKEQTSFVFPAIEFCVSIAQCSPPSKSYNIPELQRHAENRVSFFSDISISVLKFCLGQEIWALLQRQINTLTEDNACQ